MGLKERNNLWASIWSGSNEEIGIRDCIITVCSDSLWQRMGQGPTAVDDGDSGS